MTWRATATTKAHQSHERLDHGHKKGKFMAMCGLYGRDWLGCFGVDLIVCHGGYFRHLESCRCGRSVVGDKMHCGQAPVCSHSRSQRTVIIDFWDSCNLRVHSQGRRTALMTSWRRFPTSIERCYWTNAGRSDLSVGGPISR